MVVYSHYPKDQRVRREAETLKESGAKVDVICVRKNNENSIDEHNSVNIYRVPMRIKKSERGGYFMYFFRYFTFLFLSTALLTWLFIKNRYKVVHVHSIPDYLVFCAIIPKLFGAKIVLDLHEFMPEVFATKFEIPMGSKQVKIAKRLQKISVAYANIVFVVSEKQKQNIFQSTQKENLYVIMNLPKKDIFKFRNMSDFLVKNHLENSFIVSYVGGINPERELDIVIRAIKYAEKKIPNIAFVFCGVGEEEYISSIKRLVEELTLQKKAIFMGFVPQDDVLNYIAISNVALNPYKLHLNLNPVGSTKIFEYLLIPKPVIVVDYPGNRVEFEDLVLFYKSSDHRSLGDKIIEVYEHEERFKKMAEDAQKFLFKKYDPEKNEQKLVGIYKKLIS
jgi:glycosyltransferase involved in cell wall biosynthesis